MKYSPIELDEASANLSNTFVQKRYSVKKVMITKEDINTTK